LAGFEVTIEAADKKRKLSDCESALDMKMAVEPG
jgi:hypothetical protein